MLPRLHPTAPLLAAALVLPALLLSGCGGDKASATTCSQFAEMGSNTGLGQSFTSEQQDVLEKMLDEQDRMPGQEQMAGLDVISYCNIYGGHAGSHPDDAISNIPGLQE